MTSNTRESTPQPTLDYEPRNLRPSLKVALAGRFLAIASLFLPAIGIVLARRLEDTLGVFASERIVVALLYLGCACVIAALVGMFRWGARFVWSPALVGFTLNLLLILHVKYGPNPP